MRIKTKLINFLTIVFIKLFFFNVLAQEQISRQEYIQRWAEVAMEDMRTFGIPASIKLAQALLESDNGNSLLARQANNHFGIKCHSGWDGGVFHKDDDSENECFRSYLKAEESFHDHSRFLVERARYKALFELKPGDYEAWAHGLKTAGYATNPRYAHLLIKIIEDNSLSRFDAMVLGGTQGQVVTAESVHKRTRKTRGDDFEPIHLGMEREISTVNGVKYTLAQENETYQGIAREMNLAGWMIRRFNEVDRQREPRAGERVFIQPKRRLHKQGVHLASGAESLWDISAQYGVKVKRLSKYNSLTPESIPAAGSRVLLEKQ